MRCQWFFRKGIALLLVLFAGSFTLAYLAMRGTLESPPSSGGTGGSSEPALPAASEPRSAAATVGASAANTLTLPRKQDQTSSGPKAQILVLAQGGYVSKRLLGCWHGRTAGQPSEWRALSPLSRLFAYHSDDIDLCLKWENDQLKVTDSRSTCAGCNYRFSYRVVSATGEELTLEEKSSQGRLNNEGSAYFKLNQDDTIDERTELTNYFLGRPAIRMGTTARLRRRGG